MENNFTLGLSATTNEISLFMDSIIHNKSLLGFLFGLVIAALITGFIITKNPKHIPIILKYSSMDAFQKISKRDKNGTYKMAFTKFLKIYTQMRMLTLMTLISFFVMITTIILAK